MTKQYTTESQLQADFWLACWNGYPHAQHHMWSVPNDAINNIANDKDAARVRELKATGMLAGVWDLHLFWNGMLHIIETKLPGRTLTVTRIVTAKGGKPRKVFGQKEWGERVAAHGAVRHIYHTLEEGLAIFEAIVGAPGPAHHHPNYFKELL